MPPLPKSGRRKHELPPWFVKLDRFLTNRLAVWLYFQDEPPAAIVFDALAGTELASYSPFTRVMEFADGRKSGGPDWSPFVPGLALLGARSVEA